MSQTRYDWPRGTLLGDLDDKPRARLLGLGAFRRYTDPGRTLIREDDQTSFILILLDGVVKATARLQDGRDALLAVRVGGDVVGEFSAMDGRPRSATVITGGVVAARVVGKAELRAFLDREPQIAAAFDQVVVSRAREVTSRLVDFTGCDVPTRLARILWQLALRHGSLSDDDVVIRLPLTQPELATLAGSTEHTVHKILRTFREAQVVDTGYRSIRVLSMGRLNELAWPAPD